MRHELVERLGTLFGLLSEFLQRAETSYFALRGVKLEQVQGGDEWWQHLLPRRRR
jgi:hypothetical protein